MNKKKDIFLEGKLHIPLVAQFGIKNAAIEVQLGRIFVQYLYIKAQKGLPVNTPPPVKRSGRPIKPLKR